MIKPTIVPKFRPTDQSDQFMITRRILLHGDIDESEIQEIVRKILLLDAFSPGEDITLLIDSYGGGVYEAMGLVDLMGTLESPVNTMVMGKAMSAGFIIAICGATRMCTRNSTFMMHEISSGDIGKLSELEVSLNESKRMQKRVWNIMKERTKLSPRQLGKIKREDTYYGAKSALEYGIVDFIIGQKEVKDVEGL